jgi:nicotinate phosphoribosyltransferase
MERNEQMDKHGIPTRQSEGILFTDMYELTMDQLYFRMGWHERNAQFDYFFRDYPNYGKHQAGYCINAGLEWLLDWMANVRFHHDEIEYLRSQKDHLGNPLFADDFLAWLQDTGGFTSLTLHAVPEGRVVHPNEPLVVIQGPLAMAQLLESSLLNHLNYQTLIATKAARIRQGGRNRPLLEFGLRRGPEKGANAGARAALIGGADFTSNVAASWMTGYTPKGTQAHSLIQVFIALGLSELDAFRAYADLYPDDCLLLVDTVNTLESGLPNAIKVFEELRRKGHEPIGIRLDSGDLAYLSIRAAKMLNEAGFPDTSIVLSNKLDELVLWQIMTQFDQEAAHYGLDPEKLIGRMTYGVGTSLIASNGDSSLDGVYKLVAVQEGGTWLPALKISESPAKIHNPGPKRVWRVYDESGKATADLITEETEDPRKAPTLDLHHPSDSRWFRRLQSSEITGMEPLLVEILHSGEQVYQWPTIDEMRALREHDLEKLHSGVKRLVNPHVYHVSLSSRLWDLKQELVQQYFPDASL